MPSLYDLTQEVLYLQGLLEAGEIDDQTYADTVESLCVDGKMESICMVIKNLEYKAEAYKAEIDRMTERKRTIDASIKRLKDSMLNYMLVSVNKKIEAGLFTLSLQKSKSVEVTDVNKIPAEYLLPQPPKIDKKALGVMLKAGEVIDGAEIVEKTYLRIR